MKNLQTFIIISVLLSTYSTYANPFTDTTEFIENMPTSTRLASFQGRTIITANILEWATATELNNAYFEVQHSTDGINFKIIATVDGLGTRIDMANYQYTHNNPANGKNYYRLRQVNFDLSSKYSEIIEVKTLKQIQIEVSANPKENTITIQNGKGIGEIYDLTGKIVKTINLNKVKTIDITDLEVGTYYLVEDSNRAFKFIKR